MRKILYEIQEICKHNCDGTPGTQHKRSTNLSLSGKQLLEKYYNIRSVHSLKPKHIEYLAERWKKEELSLATIKQRLSNLRWLVGKISKQNIMAHKNDYYGIEKRVHVTNESKAIALDRTKLALIKDEYLKASLLLQEAFGLRQKESIKLMPGYSDCGDYIRLKPTWTKGGKARDIPIHTEEQRSALDYAKQVAGKGSLIPYHLKYYQQRNLYQNETKRNGMYKLHGLRHQYAQNRYKQLTGWECPVRNGLSKQSMTIEQCERDEKARLTISKEMGHERIQIVAVYIGS